MTKRKKIILVVISVIAVLGGFTYWWSTQNDDNVTRIVNETPQQTETNQDSTDQANEDSTNEDETANPQKDPSPPSGTKVTEPPLVYTGYGHAQEDPLGLTQETSTTCTSVAGVDCYINFKSSDGKTAKLESKKTDSQGVAVWNWVGNEVGSGTWSVTAVVSDKTSSVETIYIQ